MTEPPLYYIAYVHEDRDRFVVDLAVRLRAKGVNAWFDGWEIKVGDSLRRRMVSGQEGAQGFIVVVSKHFNDEGRIAEELDAAFVKRVNDKARIITLVLDGVDPPFALTTARYLRIRDVPVAPEELTEILDAVFGRVVAPPVGPAPPFVQTASSSHGLGAALGYKSVDTTVLRRAAEMALDADTMSFLNPERLIELAAEEGIGATQARDSIEFLCEEGWLTGQYGMDSEYARDIGLNPKTLVLYGKHVTKGYDIMYARIVNELVNGAGEDSSDALSKRIGEKHVWILAALQVMQRQGLVDLYGTAGTQSVLVLPKKPALRRQLE